MGKFRLWQTDLPLTFLTSNGSKPEHTAPVDQLAEKCLPVLLHIPLLTGPDREFPGQSIRQYVIRVAAGRKDLCVSLPLAKRSSLSL